MSRRLSLALIFAGAMALPAMAQTPSAIQNLIASGQPALAAQELTSVLQAHPDSGEAWYLQAEAQDALGHQDAARQALAQAQQLKPGLPFANPQDVTALQAHLSTAPAQHSSHVLGIIFGLIVAFVALRLFSRRRTAYPGYGAPPSYGNSAYGGFGGPQYPQQQGGGWGSSLLGGLIAGAGFAAGERVVDSFLGGGQANAESFSQPDTRDDGLQGNPGWDDSSNGGGGGDSWQ